MTKPRTERRDCFGRRIGDLVSRDGSDVHQITDMHCDNSDMIDVVCIKAPAGAWTAVGDTESNLASRYMRSDGNGAIEEERVLTSREYVEQEGYRYGVYLDDDASDFDVYLAMRAMEFGVQVRLSKALFDGFVRQRN